MSNPCDKCLCKHCMLNASIPQFYFADNVTECLICDMCKALQSSTLYAGDVLAMYECTTFIRRNELGGADNDGTLPQQNTTAGDA